MRSWRRDRRTERLTERDPQGQLDQGDSRRTVEHLGDAAADAPIHLNDSRSVGRELDL
jgi:hypothetical protein